MVETAWRNSVEATLELERDISRLGGCAVTHSGHDKLGKIFERFSFVDFHFPLARQYTVDRQMASQVNWRAFVIPTFRKKRKMGHPHLIGAAKVEINLRKLQDVPRG
jgi:hypothetical protein